jgi:hypothetical protein
MSQRHAISTEQTVHGGQAAQRRRRSAMVAVMLGLALILTAGVGLMFASPASASVPIADKSPDQSTGPTDPNGPSY